MNPAIVIGAIAVVAIVVLLGMSSFVTIGAGERGIVQEYGQVDTKTVLGEGLHTITPFKDHVVILNVQNRPVTANAESASHDLQTVDEEIVINLHPDPSRIAQIYDAVGEDYSGKVVSPAVQQVIKDITSKYDASDLVQKRSEVRDDIEKEITPILEKQGVIVDAVSIQNIKFSDQYNAAIEAKVTAEQQAETAKNLLVKVQVEAQQAVAQAKGQAEAIKTIDEALANSPHYNEWFALSKWNGVSPTTMVGSSGVVPTFTVNKP